MADEPNMRPDQSKNPGEDYANTTASETGPDGPRPRPRDARPESNYPAEQREVGENRTDAAAPKGPVNIGVKGAPPAGGAAAAGVTEDKATGGGSRDSAALSKE